MSEEKKYVLAMYDVRGKQNFIYSSNKMKEIQGASYIIRDVFNDYLLPAADEYAHEVLGGNAKGIYFERDEDGFLKENFDTDKFEERMKEGKYIGEIVYDGGGNFLTFFKDKPTYIEISRRFSASVLKEIDTLHVQSSCINVGDGRSDEDKQNNKSIFSDFSSDSKLLYRQHDYNTSQETFIHAVNTLPLVMVDPTTSRPMEFLEKNSEGKYERITRDRKKKLEKYQEEMDKLEENAEKTDDSTLDTPYQGKILDDLVLKKGENSWLGVVYIDGNNMSAKIQECYKDKDGKNLPYNEAVNNLRKMSHDIEKEYVQNTKAKIDEYLKEANPKKENNDNPQVRRLIISAGDEMTIIVKAADVPGVVNVYFNALEEKNESDKGLRTSAAGVAIFSSHAPFADAYRIAEECCESGKTKMKKWKIENADMFDFHYCQGGIGTSIDEIRSEETGDLISKPWVVKTYKAEFDENAKPLYFNPDPDRKNWEGYEINYVLEYLNTMGHSNVKGLLGACLEGKSAMRMELKRIDSNLKKPESVDDGIYSLKELEDIISKKCRTKMDDETLRGIIYDLVTVYDLWFVGKSLTGKETTDEEEN